jgi:galactokinase/mevalonate kinase-like predicted kinase
MGGGMEIELYSACPIGSGLGSSSILAATLLGVLSEFCGLRWTNDEICTKTLALEQLITAGGGWQDQFGGILPGVKLLVTEPGIEQLPVVKPLPDTLFTAPGYKPCHLLYYTGITRTAKGILSQIVQRMFSKDMAQSGLLTEIKEHAFAMANAIQCRDVELFGALLNRSWMQNKMLDSRTAPPGIERMIERISDYIKGYKLPGAGGGGYLYIMAKDADAARKIKYELTRTPPNPNARFVEMSLSDDGLKIGKYPLNINREVWRK